MIKLAEEERDWNEGRGDEKTRGYEKCEDGKVRKGESGGDVIWL